MSLRRFVRASARRSTRSTSSNRPRQAQCPRLCRGGSEWSGPGVRSTRSLHRVAGVPVRLGLIDVAQGQVARLIAAYLHPGDPTKPQFRFIDAMCMTLRQEIKGKKRQPPGLIGRIGQTIFRNASRSDNLPGQWRASASIKRKRKPGDAFSAFWMAVLPSAFSKLSCSTR
jgi:hypothetical protein